MGPFGWPPRVAVVGPADGQSCLNQRHKLFRAHQNVDVAVRAQARYRVSEFGQHEALEQHALHAHSVPGGQQGRNISAQDHLAAQQRQPGGLQLGPQWMPSRQTTGDPRGHATGLKQRQVGDGRFGHDSGQQFGDAGRHPTIVKSSDPCPSDLGHPKVQEAINEFWMVKSGSLAYTSRTQTGQAAGFQTGIAPDRTSNGGFKCRTS